MILLLSGCGMVEVSTNPSTAENMHQGDTGVPSPPPPPPPPPSPPPPPPSSPPLNPAGIWDITGSVNGNPVSEVALIANGMYFSLAASDEFGCPHIAGGDYAVDDSTFTGSGVTAMLDNCNGPNYLEWTVSGTVTRGELNLSFIDGGTQLPRLAATLDPLYNSYPSSLATLVGNWDDAGNVLTVNPDGTFFERQGNGCTITGAYTIIDPAHNLYGVSFLFDSAMCTNSIAGIQFTRLAYLTPNTSSGWYHLLEDASGVDANGARVVVFDSITPYFTPPSD
jgi:hypothetical protein